MALRGKGQTDGGRRRDNFDEIEHFIALHKKPIGLLADLSEMEGASWAARWEEMRFLQRHTDHIARMAVISNDEGALIQTAALQAPDALLPALRDHSCMALGQDGQD